MPRLNAFQLASLAASARSENSACGYLHYRTVGSARWQLKWFAIHRNLLFHYESEAACKVSGVTLLEGCHAELITLPLPTKKGEHKHGLAVYYKGNELVKLFELLVDNESDYALWAQAIHQSSFSNVAAEREQLQQKHAHVVQLLDSERQARWSYMQQTEVLNKELKKLRAELRKYKSENPESRTPEDEDQKLKMLCKVQSFFRGWLCRRRWKQIVSDYIRSPHAKNMRLRNAVVFGMVADEEEYTKNMATLVSCYLRPLKMAASSKKPVISHDDVNSIFLNSETILFLHQIFLKGLAARMENWPTLVVGDLFDMLLPMLGIYQEYVRNHHYSLQVLAEYKQKSEFWAVLKRLEEKPRCDGRVLETFLTYPMHQIPKYILTLHRLLAYTPHDHVERRQLEAAMNKLEELSRTMQDEVSETENIRKNLAIERMIIEGCDILLDVNQTFVRQGVLFQIMNEKNSRGRLSTFGSLVKEKEVVRKVFLFTHHMLLTTRATTNGDRLHLVKNYGKIPLARCTLVEDGTWNGHCQDEDGFTDEGMPINATATAPSHEIHLVPSVNREPSRNGLDFRIIVEGEGCNPSLVITLLATSLQEKAAWCSDISQCIESLGYNDLLSSSASSCSSTSISSQHTRSDSYQVKTDGDSRRTGAGKTQNLMQIRQATVNQLLDRLTDLRFLSIDFLNTFLTTYRVFTTAEAIVENLAATVKAACEKRVSTSEKKKDVAVHGGTSSRDSGPIVQPPVALPAASPHMPLPPLLSPTSSYHISEVSADVAQAGSSHLGCDQELPVESDSIAQAALHGQLAEDDLDGDVFKEDSPLLLALGPAGSSASTNGGGSSDSSQLPTVAHGRNACTSGGSSSSGSSSTSSSRSNSSSGMAGKDREAGQERRAEEKQGELSKRPSLSDSCATGYLAAPLATADDACSGSSSSSSSSSVPTRHSSLLNTDSAMHLPAPLSPRCSSCPYLRQQQNEAVKASAATENTPVSVIRDPSSQSAVSCKRKARPVLLRAGSLEDGTKEPALSATIGTPKCETSKSEKCLPRSTTELPLHSAELAHRAPSPKARSGADEQQPTSSSMLPSSSHLGREPPTKLGSIVTSSRQSLHRTFVTEQWLKPRRFSSSAATAAFAAATAGACPKITSAAMNVGPAWPMQSARSVQGDRKCQEKDEADTSAVVTRVLNVLKHWISRYSRDLQNDEVALREVRSLLEDMAACSRLTSIEQRTATSLLALMEVAGSPEQGAQQRYADLRALLSPRRLSCRNTPDALSAADIAEQLTFLDQQIFLCVKSTELLGQAWTRSDKVTRAPHVMLVTKRFNEVSQLVVSDIVSRHDINDRVLALEKWTAVAEACCTLNNYNGVLQICAAFLNSSVYRLQKTWEKLSKPIKSTVTRLQQLVSSDGRFKNMRDALHKCDTPAIPYLGLYLSDLSFIEEGSPDFVDDNTVNFSKMRMISHVIGEIQQFQQQIYRIQHKPEVTDYLLDTSTLLTDDQSYAASLSIEPKAIKSSDEKS